MLSKPACRRAVACAVAAAGLIAGGTGASAEEEGRHTVRPGDTLGAIASRNHTTVRALAAANGVADVDRIVVGQVLVIPAAGSSAPGGAAAGVVHVVAPGETLTSLARRYGTTVAELASANGIADPDLVRIGSRLTVPAPTRGGAPAASASTPTTTHTVATGETLASIAGRYGVPVGAMVSANRIANPNVIRIGQVLEVPAGVAGPTGGGGPSSGYATTGGTDGRTGVSGTHTVGAGETLTGIANRYGVPVAELATANGIPRPWSLYAGARLSLTAPNRIPSDIARCPVDGGRFANDWGFPRSGGRAHAGTDLFAPRGTPVLAPVSGIVSFGTGTIGGRQFRLAGDDGSTYIGSHMHDFGTSGRVTAGTVIGYVGDSGNAAGGATHLHFEVRPDGGPSMNPYPLLVAAC